MQALSGSLFALAAGALFYLASPRQQLMAPVRRHSALIAAGALCCLAGAILWHECVNWPAAWCATLGALVASLSAMPFIGMMTGRRAKLASLADVKPNTKTVANAGTRAGRPTGIP
jgi:hypothetical protein